jgi:plasmid segregation protein ParM
MILGVDVGYSHTKVFGKGIEFAFKSTIEEGTLDISKSIKVEYEGKEYTVGENSGSYESDLNKIHSLNFKLCLYTAIAKAMKSEIVDDNVQLVSGLPGQYYAAQKLELKNELEGKKVTIVLNNKPKKFTITKVLIFPQSAGMLLLEPSKLKGDTVVIDIGGFTVDTSYFVGKNLRDMKTWELGMNVLANTLVQKIKADHGVSYDVLKADEILDSKKIIKNGVEVDIENLVEEVLEKHAKLIVNRLQGGLPEFNTSKRIFVGGGTLRLKKYLPTGEVFENIHINSKAYYMVGVEKFE